MITIPTDRVTYTRGGSVVVNGWAIPGRYSFEVGHPDHPDKICVTIKN